MTERIDCEWEKRLAKGAIEREKFRAHQGYIDAHNYKGVEGVPSIEEARKRIHDSKNLRVSCDGCKSIGGKLFGKGNVAKCNLEIKGRTKD